MSFTPGPWAINPNGAFIRTNRDGKNESIAEVYSDANARLIIQAPAMYDALKAYCSDKRLIMTSDAPGLANEVANMMRTVLRAVEGKE